MYFKLLKRFKYIIKIKCLVLFLETALSIALLFIMLMFYSENRLVLGHLWRSDHSNSGSQWGWQIGVAEHPQRVVGSDRRWAKDTSQRQEARLQNEAMCALLVFRFKFNCLEEMMFVYLKLFPRTTRFYIYVLFPKFSWKSWSSLLCDISGEILCIHQSQHLFMLRVVSGC